MGTTKATVRLPIRSGGTIACIRTLIHLHQSMPERTRCHLFTLAFIAILLLAGSAAAFAQGTFPGESNSRYVNRHTIRMEHGFAPFRSGDQWGIADSTNQLVIPAQYDSLHSLLEGYLLAERGNDYMIYGPDLHPVFDRAITVDVSDSLSKQELVEELQKRAKDVGAVCEPAELRHDIRAEPLPQELRPRNKALVRYYDNYHTVSDSSGRFTLFNDSGDSIFAGEGLNDYFTFIGARSTRFCGSNDLVECRTNGLTTLLTREGKLVLQTNDVLLSRYSCSVYFKVLERNKNYAFIYHPGTDQHTTFECDDYEVISPDKLLVRNKREFTILDGTGKLLRKLPVARANWFGAENGGVLEVHVLTGALTAAYAYYDKDLNRLKLPHDYLFDDFGAVFDLEESADFIRFRKASGPHLYGAMDGSLTTVVPDEYLFIAYDEHSRYFVVLTKEKKLGYIRADGTRLFED